MKNENILIIGATGTVGSEVVKQLVESGHKVRVLVRDPAKVKHLGKAVEVIKGDLENPKRSSPLLRTRIKRSFSRPVRNFSPWKPMLFMRRRRLASSTSSSFPAGM
jgi:uncharacterized protein YbjT (DUF2867 family)